MKKKFAQFLTTVFALGASLLLLSACQSSTSGKKITIVAGTSGVSNPFSYEEDGKLTGYDVELLNAIFKGSNKYNLEWQKVEFSSILNGLNSGRITIGANNFSSNEDRREHYDFSNAIVKNPNVIVVREDEEVKDLSSLAGKTVVTEVGNSGASLLEEYNKENADAISIVYTKEDLAKQFQNIESGKYDARIVSQISAETMIRNNGYKLKVVKLEVTGLDVNSYFLLSKNSDNSKVLKFINQRLEELRENGEWEKISQKYLKGNFLPDK